MINRRTLLLGAALFGAPRRPPCAGASQLAGSRDPHHRAVRGGLVHRHRGAAARDRADRTARPAGRGREPRRRRQHGRHAGGRARRAGRLHAAALRHLAVDLARDLSEAAVRSAARSRVHQPHRGFARAPDGAPRPRRAHARRTGRARQAEAGRADVRLRRARLVGAHGDGAVPRHRRHQGAARAVPRHRGGDRRDGRRPRRHGDRKPRLRPVAGAGRHLARPRHHGRAQSAAARRADLRRGRPAALRRAVLVRARGTRRNAAADRRAAQSRGRARLRPAAAARRVRQAGGASPSPPRRTR